LYTTVFSITTLVAWATGASNAELAARLARVEALLGNAAAPAAP
jgi:hypothetical protein